MKTRVTFRLPDDLAQELRTLPNQTEFVEAALRDALGVQCPVCEGHGRLHVPSSLLPNWKRSNLTPLDKAQALQLKALVRLAKQLGVTQIDVTETQDRLHLTLVRQQEQLLEGFIHQGQTQLVWR